MEIERKYLVKNIPENLNSYESFTIEQFYLSNYPEVRIRKSNLENYLTIKSKGDESREEVELKISKKDYERLKPMGISKIKKKRYLIPAEEGMLCELDVYINIPDLVTVEVEFSTLKELREFKDKTPSWFGRELTYISSFKNKNLAKNINKKVVIQSELLQG